jgi:hypothetical protein
MNILPSCVLRIQTIEYCYCYVAIRVISMEELMATFSSVTPHNNHNNNIEEVVTDDGCNFLRMSLGKCTSQQNVQVDYIDAVNNDCL